MPRASTLSNGSLLVGTDDRARVRDLMFPYVGLENHISIGNIHRVGVWVDGKLYWTDDHSWEISLACEADTGSCHVVARNRKLSVLLRITEIVYNEKDIFLRKFIIENKAKQKRTIKLYFGHQFQISESRRGDTGYYDPRCNALIHFKGKRAFLINARHGDKAFDQYGVGIFEIEGKEGTHLDAEDGMLSGNPIEHGRVDSALGVTLTIKGSGSEVVHYWITAGKSIKEVQALNAYVISKSPDYLIESSMDYWHAWTNRKNYAFGGLSDGAEELFRKSLLVMRMHADNHGGIIAASDSDMFQYGRGSYSYVWPRDGSNTAQAFQRAGYPYVARRFYEFCNKMITDEGYFMHKYRPDGSLGSSWHPWIRDGKTELPIQEDETASVIHALWQYYEITNDLEFIESIYNSLIGKAADFLTQYMYPENGLPYPSYDLWEEKYGIATFTCAAKYGALIAASKFAKLLSKEKKEEEYRNAAENVRDAILKYLYLDDIKMFCKLANIKDGKLEFDRTIDMSSLYGMLKYEVLSIKDERMQEAIRTIEAKLTNQGGISGIPRYEGDNYRRVAGSLPPNPWVITTLWLAQFYIREAETEEDLVEVKNIIDWTLRYMSPTGMLSEQLHPTTGSQLSASPLVWSHSEFVMTLLDYEAKREELGLGNTRKTMTRSRKK